MGSDTLDKYHNFRSQGKKGLLCKFFNNKTWGILNFTCCQALSTFILHRKYQQFFSIQQTAYNQGPFQAANIKRH
jgi:hypothetical protein